MKLENIRLESIDFDDFTYSVWAWSDYSKIKESISATGIINPPVIALLKNGKYGIISGHKRLRALKSNGGENTDCFVVSSPFDICQYFINTLWENLSFREYNLIEKSMILNKLDSFSSCEYDVEKLVRQLGLSGGNLMALKKLSGLSEYAREIIACGKVKRIIVYKIPELSTDDGLDYLKLVSELNFGENKQGELLKLLTEISKIRDVSFRDILSEEKIKSVLSKSQWNNRQKGDHIIEILREFRLPFSTNYKKKFLGLKSSVKLVKNVKLLNKFPFEDDSAKFMVTAENSDELKQAAKCLNNIADSKDEDFFDVVSGIG